MPNALEFLINNSEYPKSNNNLIPLSQYIDDYNLNLTIKSM